MTSRRRQTGDAAEGVARTHLEQAGYRLLGSNFRCPGGEIDVIAEHGGQLVFVEVRSHSSDAFGLPRESVGAGKQRRLARAALTYLKRLRRSDVSWRFDVVEVYLDADGRAQRVEVLADAFTPEGIF